ncbi:unnamed protein product [Paramecium octaurelia]|uniref:Uncharacterized protein n=1 Tax=Paramecium octaurelia TaxID=43137 RepID=A0A8S1UW58_PAROT|nr:unnamed protein product [Paramecium octaurelia]
MDVNNQQNQAWKRQLNYKMVIIEGIWDQNQLQLGIFQGKMNNKKLNRLGLQRNSFEYEQNFITFLFYRVKAHYMDDKIQREGLLTTKKEDQYKGEFYENQKRGHGEFQTIKGDRYEGEFQKDKKQGRGTYYFPNDDNQFHSLQFLISSFAYQFNQNN